MYYPEAFSEKDNEIIEARFNEEENSRNRRRSYFVLVATLFALKNQLL
ncbi:MAG: hypothetical protein MZU79_02035 [Anaerotruncus sp.]|nr:hypothetical protein [Anaerotruncus sp.]